MSHLIADMNRLRPAPTLARETSSWCANLAFSGVVVLLVWLFEGPVLVVGAVAGVTVALLTGRLVYRAARGDEAPAPSPASAAQAAARR